MNDTTIQDVFLQYYADYIEAYAPSARQAKTAFHIMNCKTGAYGSNISTCGSCGHVAFHHNSCRDRGCPMCQELPKERWLDARRESLLEAPYYHLIVTLPHELNPICYCNQKELYALFFQSASEAVMELASDSQYLGAKPGFISILQTWSGDMSYHVHLHMLVLGGGLGDDHCWHEQGEGFFLPVGAISGLLRGKFLSGLKELRKQGRLVYAGQAEKYRNHYEYQALLDTCYEKNWVSFCKESFAGAGSVLEYIGRYTHRTAISNSRILAMDDKNVTFRVKDRKSGTWKEATITGVEFIRRFLMHVLPKRFVKIRHYGLWSNRNKKTLLTVCRNLIGCRVYLSRLKDLDSSGILKELYGIDVNTCPCCGGSLQNRRDCRMRKKLLYVT